MNIHLDIHLEILWQLGSYYGSIQGVVLVWKYEIVIQTISIETILRKPGPSLEA